MKSSRWRVASSSRQNASTLGVWRRSSPKISSRSDHSREIGLRGITRRRVARETRGDDEMRARAQQLQAGLIADLHAPAGQQRHAAGQVRRLRPLREIQLRAGGTELVVEMMDRLIVLLADVAVPRLRQHPRLVAPVGSEQKVVRRREHRLPAQLADPGRGEHLLRLLRQRRLAQPRAGLHQPPPRPRIGIRHHPRRVKKPLPLLRRQLRQQPAILVDRLEQLRRRAHALQRAWSFRRWWSSSRNAVTRGPV